MKMYCKCWCSFRGQVAAIQMQIVDSFRQWHKITSIRIPIIAEMTFSPVASQISN